VPLNFGVGLPLDQPLTAEAAVRRGHYFVTLPVFAIMIGLWVTLFALAPKGPIPPGIGSVALMVGFIIGPPGIAWIWWSYAVPRWRHWALSRGVEPAALQELAEEQKLVWPKGHFLERTEFPYHGPEP
jgi:hypothetical protein